MTTRTIALESYKERPGYERQKFSDVCAVCPFCGKINDLTRIDDTRCHHFVREAHALATRGGSCAGALFASPSAEAMPAEDTAH